MKKVVCIFLSAILLTIFTIGCSPEKVVEEVEKKQNLSMEELALERRMNYNEKIRDLREETKLRWALEHVQSYSLANDEIYVIPPEEVAPSKPFWEQDTYVKLECEVVNVSDVDNFQLIKAVQTDDEGYGVFTFTDPDCKILYGEPIKPGDKLIIHTAEYQGFHNPAEIPGIETKVYFQDKFTGEQFEVTGVHDLVVMLATKVE